MESRSAQRSRTATATEAWLGWRRDEQPFGAWRLRIRLDDRPGMLASIAVRMADLNCNILGLTVLPVPGGVLDEVVIRPAHGVTKAQLIKAIEDEGCECSAITDADVRELVDTPAATLSAASRAVEDPSRYPDALREVLAADMVTVVPLAEADPGRTEGGHRLVIAVDDERAFVARRRWAPFAGLELARAEALLGLFAGARINLSEPRPVTCTDGAMIVVRQGRPADTDAVLAMHERCSPETLFQRYQTTAGGIPRRWLRTLLLPEGGLSLLAVCGRDGIGLGQLIVEGAGEIPEVSLLVEDAWQRNGVGTALMARLALFAVARGHEKLVTASPPGNDVISRTARRAGLVPERPGEGGRLRISIRREPAWRIPGG